MSENNCEKVVLPIVYPPITSFPAYSSVLSILWNFKKTKDWIYNNFVNLWGTNEISQGGGVPISYSSWWTMRLCPFINYGQVQRDVAKAHYPNTTDLLLSYITLGYYLYCSYDMYYISHSRHYKKNHKYHQLFIYGYDKERKTFNVSDFFYNGKLSFEEVSFEEVEKAIDSVEEFINPLPDFFIDTLKYVDIDYNLNTILLKKNLTDYVNSTNTYLSYEDKILCEIEKKYLLENKIVFGIANYDLIIECLIDLLNGKDKIFIDIRPFHVLWDHKVLMSMRIKYLTENHIIKDDRNLYNRYEEIKNICLMNRSLFIKYYKKKDNGILNRIIENLNIIKCEEKNVMNDLIDKL